MKIYVHYDSEGTIRSVVCNQAPAGAGAMLIPQPGHLVAEVEGLAFKGKTPTDEELQEISKNYKVSLPVAGVKLTKRRDA